MAQVIILSDIANLIMGYGKYAGAYKVASEVRQAGYTCQVIDNYTYIGAAKLKILLEKFIDDTTVLLGVSCALNEKIGNKVLFWGLADDIFMDLLVYAKKLNPNIKIVAGGPKVNEYSDWESIDYIIQGKADNSIVALVDHLTIGAKLEYDTNKHSKIIKEVNYPYSQEDFAKSTIKFEHNDIVFLGEALPLEIARGCVFKCSFCKYDLVGKKPNEWTKSPDTLLEEFTRNYEMFGTTHYNISDELINESVEKLEMLHSVTSKLPFKIRYTGYARADMIWRYPQMRELLIETGAECLMFGIETFHPVAGKSIGKGLDPAKIKETLHYCRELWRGKILMTANFIVGLPHEPKEHIWETFDYLTSDQCPFDIFTFTKLGIDLKEENYGKVGRGISKIESNPEKYGIRIESDNQWVNTNLSSKEATALLKAIESHPKFINISRYGSFKWFGRAVSLGYTIEDFFEMLQSKKPVMVKDIVLKTLELKEKYYQELLKLPSA